MNNATASFGDFFVIYNRILANLATVLAMVIAVGALYAPGELKIFKRLASSSNK